MQPRPIDNNSESMEHVDNHDRWSRHQAVPRPAVSRHDTPPRHVTTTHHRRIDTTRHHDTGTPQTHTQVKRHAHHFLERADIANVNINTINVDIWTFHEIKCQLDTHINVECRTRSGSRYRGLCATKLSQLSTRPLTWKAIFMSVRNAIKCVCQSIVALS